MSKPPDTYVLPPTKSDLLSILDASTQNPLIAGVLSSVGENAAKKAVGDAVGGYIKRCVAPKVAKLSVTIPQALTVQEQHDLITWYPNFHFSFSASTNHGHALAAASRKVERLVLLEKIQYDPLTAMSACEALSSDYTAFISDVGGNFTTNILSDSVGIHSCSPVINNLDSNRFTNRFTNLHNGISNKSISTATQMSMVADFQRVHESSGAISTETVCFNKFQDCKVRTPYGMALHSIYDMSLKDIAIGMRNKGMLSLYGSFIYADRIFLHKEGKLPNLNVTWKISGERKGLWGTDAVIQFYFEDGTAPYKHRCVDYFKFIGVTSFVYDDIHCFVEMLENVDGIQYFKVNRLSAPYVEESSYIHRIPLPSLKGKMRIQFRLTDYDQDDVKQMMLACIKGDVAEFHDLEFSKKLSDSNYYKLSIKTLLSDLSDSFAFEEQSCGGTIISFAIDEQLYNKSMGFVLNSDEKKFKPNEVYSFVRSAAASIFVGTTILRRYDECNPIKLFIFSHALYLYAWDLKFKVGRDFQDQLAAIRFNRELPDKSVMRKLITYPFVGPPDKYSPKTMTGACWDAFDRWVDKLCKANVNYNLIITKPNPYIEVPIKISPYKKKNTVFLDTKELDGFLSKHVKPLTMMVMQSVHPGYKMHKFEPFDEDLFKLRYPDLVTCDLTKDLTKADFYHYSNQNTNQDDLPSLYEDNLRECLHLSRSIGSDFFFPAYYDAIGKIPEMFHRYSVSIIDMRVGDFTMKFFKFHRCVIPKRNSLNDLLVKTYKLVWDNLLGHKVYHQEDDDGGMFYAVVKQFCVKPVELVSPLKVYPSSHNELSIAENVRFATNMPLEKPDIELTPVMVTRAGVKLAQMDRFLQHRLSSAKSVLDLCASPGSYGVYMHHKNPAARYWSVSGKGDTSFLNRRYTIKGISYIDDGLTTFDIKKPDDRDFVKSTVGKVDLVLADGGVDVRGDYGGKGSLNDDLILSEVLMTDQVLADGGSLLLKVYSFDTLRLPVLLAKFAACFTSVMFLKPAASPMTNRERYIYFHEKTHSMCDKSLAAFKLLPDEFVSRVDYHEQVMYEVLMDHNNRFNDIAIISLRVPPTAPEDNAFVDEQGLEVEEIVSVPRVEKKLHTREHRNVLTPIHGGYVHPINAALVIKTLNSPGDGHCYYHSVFKNSVDPDLAFRLFSDMVSEIDKVEYINDVCLSFAKSKFDEATSDKSCYGDMMYNILVNRYCDKICTIVQDTVVDVVWHYNVHKFNHFDATVNLCANHFDRGMCYSHFNQYSVLKNVIVYDDVRYFVAFHVEDCVVCATIAHEGDKYIPDYMRCPEKYRIVKKLDKGKLCRLTTSIQKPVEVMLIPDRSSPVNRSENSLQTQSKQATTDDLLLVKPEVSTGVPQTPVAQALLRMKQSVVDEVIKLDSSKKPPIPSVSDSDPEDYVDAPDDETVPVIEPLQPLVAELSSTDEIPEVNLSPDWMLDGPVSIGLPGNAYYVDSMDIDVHTKVYVYPESTASVVTNGDIVTLKLPIAFDGTVNQDVIRQVLVSLKNSLYGVTKVLFVLTKPVDISNIVGELQRIQYFIYRDPEHAHQYPPIYLDDKSPVNCMLEQRHIWATDDTRTKDDCDAYYKEVSETVAVSDVTIDGARGAFRIANSFCTWVSKPTRDPVDWGYAYDGKNFVSVKDLFLPNYNFLELDKLKRTIPDGLYVITKCTNIMNNLSLYRSVADIYPRDRNIKVEIVAGVPGAGKTQYIVDNHSPNDIVATATRDAAENLRIRVKRVMPDKERRMRYRTIDSLIIHISEYKKTKCDTLWIDEAMMKHVGCCFWAAYLLGAKRLVLCGDRGQIGYFSPTSYKPMFSLMHPEVKFDSSILNISHRVPLDVAYLLDGIVDTDGEKVYTNGVLSTNGTVHSMDWRSWSDFDEVVSKMPDAQVLTYTQAEKSELVQMGYTNTRTVGEYQGRQEHAIILVRKNTAELAPYNDVHQIIVAISRHMREFVYITVKEDTLVQFVQEVKETTADYLQKYSSKGGAYTYNSDETPHRFFPRFVKNKQYPEYDLLMRMDYALNLRDEDNKLRDVVTDNGGTGYVHAKPMMKEIPVYDVQYSPLTSYSKVSSPVHTLQAYISEIRPNCDMRPMRYLDDIFLHDDIHVGCIDFAFKDTGGIINTTDYLTPSLRTPMYAPFRNNVPSILKTYNERNGNVPQLADERHIDVLTDEMVDAFVKAYCRPGNLVDFYSKNPLQINTDSMSDWMTTQTPEVYKKMLATDEFTLIDKVFPQYTFMLKKNAKPVLDPHPENKFPSPQAVVYPDKIYNYVYCPLVRDMKQRIISTLKPDKIIFTDMDTRDFEKILNHRFPPSKMKQYPHTCELDFSKYDKSQNLTTLLFEIKMMRKFGMTEDLIAIWLIMHLYSLVTNRETGLSFLIYCQRKSGDAMTYLGNTLFLMAVIAIVVGIDIVALAFLIVSGDDMYMRSLLQLDLLGASKRASVLFNLEMKLMKYNTPYFCSRFLLPLDDRWVCVPDLWKLIIKLGRRDLVSYEHVEEYRRSLYDNIYGLRDQCVYEAVSMAMADRYGTRFACDHLIDTLRTLIDDPAEFAELYYLSDNDELSKYTYLPSLEI